MGYAQLSEGRVEKLDVIQKIDQAIELVFPAAVPSEIKVVKKIAGQFPPLLMQRAHFSEILMNLLQNAREAVGERGNILVAAAALRDHAIEISVADDGPGIVKHNAELYGGRVRVESALGKGAKITVVFPARALPKPFLK